ncbi:Autophagy-related protein 9 [Entamoeba marina]
MSRSKYFIQHVPPPSNSLQLPETSLPHIYEIWRKGGYLGLFFDRLIPFIELVTLYIMFIGLLHLDIFVIITSSSKGSSLSSFFTTSSFRFYCSIITTLLFIPIIYGKLTRILNIVWSSDYQSARAFYNENKFVDFNKNWNGIAAVIAPSTSHNRRSYIRTTATPNYKTDLLVRWSIVWKENLLTLVYNKYSIFKQYPSKYVKNVVESILFPKFFDDEFCKKVQYDQDALEKWKMYIQCKADEVRFAHAFPMCLIRSFYIAYTVALKYFSSLTGKDSIALTKCRFTTYSKLLYRKCNELPHETSARLTEAVPFAYQMIGINQKTFIYHILDITKRFLSSFFLFIIPLALITKFTIYAIPSSLLLMIAIPVIALIYSSTRRKKIVRAPKETAKLLQKYTYYVDDRWDVPLCERELLNEFEGIIFKSSLNIIISEILSPFTIGTLLKSHLFQKNSPVVDLILQSIKMNQQPTGLVRNNTVSTTQQALSAFLTLKYN